MARTANHKKWHIAKEDWTNRTYCDEFVLNDSHLFKLFAHIADHYEETNLCDECREGFQTYVPADNYEEEREWANNHMASIMGKPSPSDFGDWLAEDEEEEAA